MKDYITLKIDVSNFDSVNEMISTWEVITQIAYDEGTEKRRKIESVVRDLRAQVAEQI